jgi:hypothetical protein
MTPDVVADADKFGLPIARFTAPPTCYVEVVNISDADYPEVPNDGA